MIDAKTNTLIETVPQGSGSHSVAADSKRNLIFVPQVAPVRFVGTGGDTTTVGENLCGSTNGCVVVFKHNVESMDRDDEDDEVAENHDGREPICQSRSVNPALLILVGETPPANHKVRRRLLYDPLCETSG